MDAQPTDRQRLVNALAGCPSAEVLAMLVDAARREGVLQEKAGRMEPVELVRVAARLRNGTDQVLREQVDQARGAGVSWADIGKALQVTRQAAWERYSTPPASRLGVARPARPRRPARPGLTGADAKQSGSFFGVEDASNAPGPDHDQP